MTDYVPTQVNIKYQRGDGGHSSRTISFTHPFAAVDITEARLYIRNRVDGTLYVQIKLSTHPTQWSLGTDYVGSVTPASDDTGALSEADYRYEIEVKTATATVTVQQGIWFSRGDIATDLALDDPPTNSYYLSSDERDALDTANNPGASNPIVTESDLTDERDNQTKNSVMLALYGIVAQALSWSGIQSFLNAISVVATLAGTLVEINQSGMGDIVVIKDGGVSVVRFPDQGGIVLVGQAGGYQNIDGLLGYDSVIGDFVGQTAQHDSPIPIGNKYQTKNHVEIVAYP